MSLLYPVVVLGPTALIRFYVYAYTNLEVVYTSLFFLYFFFHKQSLDDDDDDDDNENTVLCKCLASSGQSAH